MKQIKISFDSKIPQSFWESERVQKMAPTPLFENSCLIRLPDRRVRVVIKVLSKWMAEQGYQKYSIEQSPCSGRAQIFGAEFKVTCRR